MLRRVPVYKAGPESSNPGARLKPLGGEMKNRRRRIFKQAWYILLYLALTDGGL